MDLKSKSKLLWLRFKGEINKADALILEAALSQSASGTYRFSCECLLLTVKRRTNDEPIRACIRCPHCVPDPQHRLGVAATLDGAKFLEGLCENAATICRFIHEWNVMQKEKDASRYSKGRRVGDFRPRRGSDQDKNS